ncbi:MAG: sigma-70 family RNA polymerase sigma factor [Phycisphaerae bacterium]|nr:sigma-70 family RNA polymerase sigma factor [Phycisphaerae bacterium]
MPSGESHPDPRSDADLVASLNAGDFRAFEPLYHRYRDWVIALAYRLTGNHEDALDVCQETFAYLLRKCPGLTLSAKLTTLLYPAVRHLARDARRKRSRHAGAGDAALEGAIAAEGGPDAVEVSRQELAAVLAGLPEGRREVLLMRFVDAMSLPEIAAALDIPLGTVKSRLHHALDALRNDDRLRRHFDSDAS